MSYQFRKFVEWATDSRYVPLGSCCSLCGKKLEFFRTGFWSINAGKLADGILCKRCMDQMERLFATMHEWMEEDALQQAPWNLFNINSLHRMPLQTAKELLAAKEAKDQECLAAFGSNMSSLFRIEDTIQIDPSAIQAGVVRARRLKNKIVVFGTVERSSFSRYDKVQIVQENDVVSTAILEAYLYNCEANTIDLCLRANMGKHQLCAYESGWLVLDTEERVEVGNIVVG